MSTSFNAVRGAPPSIEFKSVAELEVDDTYQRSADDGAGRSLIRAIANGWDWRLCAPLTVSRRDSRFFVIDGQHRMEAAKLRGDIPFLPCIISSFDTLAEEAGCFVQVNTRRRQVTPLETFKAELAAGDPTAIKMNAVITESGLSVAKHGNPVAWKPGQISALSGVRGAIGRIGETLTRRALEDLAQAFPTEVLRYSGRILPALYSLHADPRLTIDRDRLRAALALRDQAGWFSAMIQRQAKYGELAESAMIYAIVESYEGLAE